jgi:ABC-type Fe3+-hydroxamate transport system substrate-binding protein
MADQGDHHVIRDELGRQLSLPRPPRRIVSLVPSLTEYLFFLGAGDRVVGVTDYCTAPAEGVASRPKVRGTKNPDVAAIVALQPDLVLLSKEENRQRDVLALEAAGVPAYVTDIETVAAARASLARLAELIGCPAAAAPLLAEIDAELAVCAESSGPPQRVAAAIWRDPWMLVGAGTYAHDLLRVCGGLNVAAALDGRYPRVSLDELAALGAGLLLLPDEPYRFGPADLPDVAGLAGRALLCDGALLTWYGPRLPQALRHWRRLLRDPEPCYT